MIKIAINGFGRIGRAVLRAVYEHGVGVKIVAINDLAEPEALLHLLKYDSAFGPFQKEVKLKSASFLIEGDKIKILSEKDPADLPWENMGVDVVLECTGFFTHREGVQKHIQAGAEFAVISANAKGEDVPHFVLGVNEGDFDADKNRISAMCSCTTNCAVPVLSVLNEEFNLLKAHMLTIHAVTSSQNLVDGSHKDLRRARSALANSIPTTTGSDKAVVRIMPEFKGRLSASAVRVPVLCGSLLEVVASLENEASSQEINGAFRKAARTRLKDTVSVSHEPLVSTDVIGTTEGAIVDLLSTETLDRSGPGDENLAKIIAWYDNEYAYGYRLAKFAEYIGSL